MSIEKILSELYEVTRMYNVLKYENKALKMDIQILKIDRDHYKELLKHEQFINETDK